MNAEALQVRDYMTWPVHTTSIGSSARDVFDKMRDLSVSALPVRDSSGSVVGIISRSDLLAIGQPSDEGDKKAPDARHVFRAFSDEVCADLMTRFVIRSGPDAPLVDACRRMVETRVHRVVVENNDKLVGILSTLDVMYAVRDLHCLDPIELAKSDIVRTIDVNASYEHGVEQLKQTGIHGLVVTENDWPVGVFSQIEALAARHEAPSTLIEEVMDPALICMPHETSMFRAAQQAIRMRTRRIVVVHNRKIHGILSGFDFARYLAGAGPTRDSQAQKL